MYRPENSGRFLFALSGYKIARGGVGGFDGWFVVGDVFRVKF